MRLIILRHLDPAVLFRRRGGDPQSEDRPGGRSGGTSAGYCSGTLAAGQPAAVSGGNAIYLAVEAHLRPRRDTKLTRWTGAWPSISGFASPATACWRYFGGTGSIRALGMSRQITV